MRAPLLILALAALTGLAWATPAAAHAPLRTGGNDSLATATVIPDPTKSWALYNRLAADDQAQYYRFQAAAGQTIRLHLFTSPAAKDDGFVPSVAILGPGVSGEDSPPGFVEEPPGAGALVLAGEPPAGATYEPFSPSATRDVAETDFEVPRDGTYVLVVYAEDRGGHYGLAVGSRESFTPMEWITSPLFFASIYAWERQPLWLVYLPAALVVAGGGLLLLRRHRRGRRVDLPARVAATAGLLFVASGVTVVVQMVAALFWSSPTAAAAVTVVLAALPAALGTGVLVLALRRSGEWSLGSRLLLAALGVGGLALWAGWMVGPALAVVAAVLPSRALLADEPGAARSRPGWKNAGDAGPETDRAARDPETGRVPG